MTDLPNRPTGRDDVILRQLDDEWVIYDPKSDDLHVLNQTAALVWLYCTGDNEFAGIVEALQPVFEGQVSTEQLVADIESTLNRLMELGLFE